MFLRKLLVALLLTGMAVAGGLVGRPQAAMAADCTTQGYTLQTKEVKYGSTVYGWVELRYSQPCGHRWSRVTLNTNLGVNLSNVSLNPYLAYQGSPIPNTQNLWPGRSDAYGNSYYSPFGSQSPAIQACAFIFISGWNTGSGCTDYAY